MTAKQRTVLDSVLCTFAQIEPPERKVETSKQELLDFHRKMWMMRRVELAADQLYKQVCGCSRLEACSTDHS